MASSGIICDQDLPNWLNPDCGDPVPRDGGIEYFAIADGDIDQASSSTQIIDLTSEVEWKAAIDAGNVIIVGPLIGEKPAATATSKKVRSSQPPKTVNQLHTITFTDMETTNDNRAAWLQLMQNMGARKFGYITSHGYPINMQFSGWVDASALDVSKVIEPNKEDGNQMWQGSMTWNQLGEPVEVNWPPLVQGVDF